MMECKISFEDIYKVYNIKKNVNEIIGKLNNYSNEIKDIPYISDYLSYFLKTPSKRKRLIKLLAVANLTGGINENVLRIINALEFVNSTIFIHDDIIDHDFERKGKPTLNKLIGYEKTLLVGNILYFLAMSELNDINCDKELKEEIITDFTHSLFLENSGQYSDIHFRKNFDGVSLDKWEQMVLRHSGYYVISALKAIAKLNGRRDIIKDLEEYEKNCTLAGAAEDALIGFIGNKKPRGDIENFGFTILIHYGFKGKDIPKKYTVKFLEEKIRENGAIKKTKEYIKEKISLSLNSLNNIKEGYDKDVLKFLVCQILEDLNENE